MKRKHLKGLKVELYYDLEGLWHVEDKNSIAGGYLFETGFKSGNFTFFQSFVAFPRLKARKMLRKIL